MAETTGIQWTDATYNPWYGCLKVSPGCKQCYMYRDMKRYGRDPMVVKRAASPTFNSPLKWKESKRVFTCSWSDFFIDQADSWRDDAWEIIRRTPHLTYQILTKRPENIETRLPEDWEDGYKNVWLGVSVESMNYYHRIAILNSIPAKIHFVSYEPALEFVDFTMAVEAGWIDWLISGGESGANPREADLVWFMAVKNLCNAFGVPFFHKQHGGNRKIDGAWGGRVLDGQTWDQFPE